MQRNKPGKSKPQFSTSVGLYRKFFTDRFNKNIHLFPITNLIVQNFDSINIRQVDNNVESTLPSKEQLETQLQTAANDYDECKADIEKLKANLIQSSSQCANPVIEKVMKDLIKNIEEMITSQEPSKKQLNNSLFFLPELESDEIQEDIRTFEEMTLQIKTIKSAAQTILDMVASEENEVRTQNTP